MTKRKYYTDLELQQILESEEFFEHLLIIGEREEIQPTCIENNLITEGEVVGSKINEQNQKDNVQIIYDNIDNVDNETNNLIINMETDDEPDLNKNYISNEEIQSEVQSTSDIEINFTTQEEVTTHNIDGQNQKHIAFMCHKTIDKADTVIENIFNSDINSDMRENQNVGTVVTVFTPNQNGENNITNVDIQDISGLGEENYVQSEILQSDSESEENVVDEEVTLRTQHDRDKQKKNEGNGKNLQGTKKK